MTTTTRQLDCPNCKSHKTRPLHVLKDLTVPAWAKRRVRPETADQWRRCIKCDARWDSSSKV